MELLLLMLLALVVALLVALRRSRRRQQAVTRRLARAVGHPAASTRQTRATELAQLLAEVGLIAERRGTTVTAIGLDGQYVLHVLPESIPVGYDTNRGRQFVGIAHSVAEARDMVARHAGLPTTA